MTRIGLLSDTHGYWDDRYLRYFEPCDEIWHAGDIGSAPSMATSTGRTCGAASRRPSASPWTARRY